MRNKPHVSGFNRVKLQAVSHLNAGRTLSQIVMDVELGVSMFVAHFCVFFFRKNCHHNALFNTCCYHPHPPGKPRDKVGPSGSGMGIFQAILSGR